MHAYQIHLNGNLVLRQSQIDAEHGWLSLVLQLGIQAKLLQGLHDLALQHRRLRVCTGSCPGLQQTITSHTLPQAATGEQAQHLQHDVPQLPQTACQLAAATLHALRAPPAAPARPGILQLLTHCS